MELNKKISLKGIFFRYFFSIVSLSIIITLMIIGLFMLGIKNEFILPANAIEYSIKISENQIANSKDFDSSLIPKGAKYILLSKNNEIIESNMNETEVKDAISYLKGDRDINSYDGYYFSIKRDDGLCLIHYYLRASFSIDFFNKYLPNIDILFIGIYLIAIFLSIIAISFLFAKKLNNQLLPILNAAEKISEQDLDFEVGKSNIKELNHILKAISDMKDALKESLTKQWREEQLKKEQISALAHDIKTPLTIIRINVELLKSSELNEKDIEYTESAINNINRIEDYLRLLIELNSKNEAYGANIKQSNTDEFLSELKKQVDEIIKTKQIKIDFHISELPKKIYIDEKLISRAIINIISNAVDFSDFGSSIKFSLESYDNNLIFIILDEGIGFSPEDLKNAKNQFYIGDKSRNKKSNYGMGLYIADTIANLHGGDLIIENSDKTNGAKVTIKIPIKK
ncbi:MAG: HAMP domain-containing sensor histidine kinase [Tissierellia bacterium]|nr:HAMP domain-containing sensor histidine kinase [Tissierellia bacterium]